MTSPSKLLVGQSKIRDWGQAIRGIERADPRVVTKGLANPSLVTIPVIRLPSLALAVHVLRNFLNLLLPLVMSAASKMLIKGTLSVRLSQVSLAQALPRQARSWVFSHRQSSLCWKP